MLLFLLNFFSATGDKTPDIAALKDEAKETRELERKKSAFGSEMRDYSLRLSRSCVSFCKRVCDSSVQCPVISKRPFCSTRSLNITRCVIMCVCVCVLSHYYSSDSRVSQIPVVWQVWEEADLSFGHTHTPIKQSSRFLCCLLSFSRGAKHIKSLDKAAVYVTDLAGRVKTLFCYLDRVVSLKNYTINLGITSSGYRKHQSTNENGIYCKFVWVYKQQLSGFGSQSRGCFKGFPNIWDTFTNSS